MNFPMITLTDFSLNDEVYIALEIISDYFFPARGPSVREDQEIGPGYGPDPLVSEH
jgi:hypothetical protein